MKIWNWIGKLGLLAVLGVGGGMLAQVFTGMIPAGIGQGVVIPQVSAQSGATLSGLYAAYSSSNWGPIYPVTIPPVAGSWTAGGSASTLTNITGGGLTFKSGLSNSLASGYFEAAAGSTFTFTVLLTPSVANGGALGVFCSDVSGNASLLHYSSNAPGISVSHWTGMQNGGTPAYQNSLLATTTLPFPLSWFRIQVTGGNRLYSYSTDGQNWTQVATEASTAFVTCSNVGFHGFGDGTALDSIATLVSVSNSTP